MKNLKRVFTMVLTFILFFSVLKIEPVAAVQAASKSSKEKEIEKLENDIAKWEKELAEYEKKSDKALKNTIGIMAGTIVNFDPLIIKGGIMHLEIPYLHITNYTPDLMDELVGAINGFFRKTGTYTYQINGINVPDYEKVNDYSEECSTLKNKISKAKKKLETLKADLYAEFTLESANKITMGKGQDYTIWYTLSSGVSDSTITWKSSDKTVATVSKTGVIKAKGVGKAKITGKAKVNGKTVTINVTVKESAESISLKTKSVELATGETKQLKATISPAKSYAYIFWECSDESVAAVDENGVVTAVAPGTAYIYASTSNNKVSNVCKITVKGEDVPYKKASNREAAISMVKASGYLEDGIDYFFESIGYYNFDSDIEKYIVVAYPDIDERLKILSGASKKTKGELAHETYYLKADGKKVYCLDEFDISNIEYIDFFDPKEYVMLKGLEFETASISIPQDAYQKLTLRAKNVGQFDYLKITSANPDVAEVVFSEKTGEPYIKGKSQGNTTITAEAKNGQKAVLQVEVNGKMQTEDEAFKEAEDAWRKENTKYLVVEPGDKQYYDDMNTYAWWKDWYAADNLTKIDMFCDQYGEAYGGKQYAYTDPEGWIDIIIDTYLEGMGPEDVEETYKVCRDIYENGLVKEKEPDEDDLSWEYEEYMNEAMLEYEKKNKQYTCKEPITPETYQGKHKSGKSYSNKESIPFQKYYVLLEKDSGAIVFAAQEWYKMKAWLVGEKFLK